MPRATPSMTAGEFKAKCLAVLDDVRDTGEAVLVTKRGRNVARVTPLERIALDDFPFPDLSHMFEFIGDVVSPIDVEWEAMK